MPLAQKLLQMFIIKGEGVDWVDGLVLGRTGYQPQSYQMASWKRCQHLRRVWFKLFPKRSVIDWEDTVVRPESIYYSCGLDSWPRFVSIMDVFPDKPQKRP